MDTVETLIKAHQENIALLATLMNHRIQSVRDIAKDQIESSWASIEQLSEYKDLFNY